MKMNLSIFKKGKPIYWIAGGIVLFIVFYWYFNRGSSSTGSVTTVNSGPSDAQVAAATQLQLAQLQYGSAASQTQSNNDAAVAIATLQANSQAAQTQAAADVAKYSALTNATTAANYYTMQQNVAQTNAEYGLETAQVAAQSNLAQWQLNANVLTHQMDVQSQEFQAQLNAAAFQTAISTLPSLGHGHRVETLDALTSQYIQGLSGAAPVPVQGY